MVERRAQNRSLGIRPSLFSEHDLGNANPSRILNDLERRGRGNAKHARRAWLRRSLWSLAAVLPLITLGIGWWWATTTFEDPAPMAIVFDVPALPAPVVAEGLREPATEAPAFMAENYAGGIVEEPVPEAAPEGPAPQAAAQAAPMRKVSAISGKSARRASKPAPNALSDALEGRVIRTRAAASAKLKAGKPGKAASKAELAALAAPAKKAGGGTTVAHEKEKDVVLLSAMVAHRKPGVAVSIVPKTSYKACLSLSGKAGEQCRVRECRKIGKDEVTCSLESKDTPPAKILKPV
ncbi:MAG: hypothetical protein V4857_06900 [Pseudomonadota bacterium]